MGVPFELFDDDYLYFYADVLGAQRSDADAALISDLLSLRPGMRVLDAPCGEGRISGRLAQRGCDVVGIDATERFLELARDRHPGVEFERRDLRELEYEHEFDAAVNWFTSFGYFDPQTNDGVLAGLARALRPGGRLLLELHNPWRLQRLLEASGGTAGVIVNKGSDVIADRVTYDEAARRSRTERFVVRDGRVRELEFSLEQVNAPDLVRRLRRAGFERVELRGDGGAPFAPDARRLIAIAQRAGPGVARERPAVSLREVDAANVRAVCDLELAPGQRTYMAAGRVHARRGQHEARAWVRAIYAGDEVVGLLALIADTEASSYWLARLLIGAQHQTPGVRPRRDRPRGRSRAIAPRGKRAGYELRPGAGEPEGVLPRDWGFEPTGEVSTARRCSGCDCDRPAVAAPHLVGLQPRQHGLRRRGDVGGQPLEQRSPPRVHRDRLTHVGDTAVRDRRPAPRRARPKTSARDCRAQLAGLLVQAGRLVVAALVDELVGLARERVGAVELDQPAQLGERLGVVLDVQRDDSSPTSRRQAGTTRIAADWRPRMSPPAASAASSASSRRGVSGPSAAVKASSIAGHTRSLAMMFAWQETPSPMACPANGMQPEPVCAATRAGGVDDAPPVVRRRRDPRTTSCASTSGAAAPASSSSSARGP